MVYLFDIIHQNKNNFNSIKFITIPNKRMLTNNAQQIDTVRE